MRRLVTPSGVASPMPRGGSGLDIHIAGCRARSRPEIDVEASSRPTACHGRDSTPLTGGGGSRLARSVIDVEHFDSLSAVALQRRVWRVQRVAWALMALAVLAALLGLMGSGPLSQRSVASADGTVRVEYERFLRRGAPTTLTIHARPADRESSVHALWLGRSYLESVRVEGVLPPPEGVHAGHDRVVWNFEGSSRDPGAPLMVTIRLVPAAIGRLGAAVGRDREPGFLFSQWVYP